jgi:DNA-binding SARP family transcriptional activator
VTALPHRDHDGATGPSPRLFGAVQKNVRRKLQPTKTGKSLGTINPTSGERLMTSTPFDDQPPISMRLLDGFQLLVGGEPVPVLPSSQRLLAFLALHDGSATRTTVAATLWPAATTRRSSACLRSALWRLVKPPYALVETGRARLGIEPAVQVDVDDIRRFVTGPVPAEPLLSVATLAADLLPGWTEQWVVAERDWFRQVCLRALEQLSERFRASGDHFHAQETAQAAVRSDPLRESAHRRLIELHLADGNPAAALRQFTEYRSLLRTELGLSPSREIRQLLAPVFLD